MHRDMDNKDMDKVQYQSWRNNSRIYASSRNKTNGFLYPSFSYAALTHLGKIRWWVFPSAQVGQSPHCIACCCETVGFSEQSGHDNTGPSCYYIIFDTFRQREVGHLLLQRRQDSTVEHVVSALSIISCYVPQRPHCLKHNTHCLSKLLILTGRLLKLDTVDIKLCMFLQLHDLFLTPDF